jgi:hypothetical protein
LVWGRPIDRKKTPSSTSTTARHSACRTIMPRDCPRASRLPIENGSETPTRNENDG